MEIKSRKNKIDHPSKHLHLPLYLQNFNMKKRRKMRLEMDSSKIFSELFQRERREKK